MANRYWVGGTGNWDNTNTANWSTSSGGSGGASIPTSTDDVFLDSNSGTGTITVGVGGATCQSFDCTGYAGTLTGGSYNFTPYGSVTLSASMTLSGSLSFYLNTPASSVTNTLTSNGKVIPGTLSITSTSTATWQLGDAASCNDFVCSANFNTSNYSLTSANNMVFNSARTVNLGSSSIYFRLSWVSTDATTTINYGTSTIYVTTDGVTSEFSTTSGQTVYNISWTPVPSSSNTLKFNQAFNCNTLRLPTATTDGTNTVYFSGNVTVSGTLYLNSTASYSSRRLRIGSPFTWIPTPITLTCNAVADATYGTISDIDFIGVTFAGSCVSGGNITGTRLGNLGSNGTNITFATPKNAYFVGSSSTWENSGNWSLSAGGSPSNAAFPLAQDTAYISDYAPASGATVTNSMYVGNLNASSRTNAMNLDARTIYGSLDMGNITMTGGSVYFVGDGTQTVNLNGKTITGPLYLYGPGTVRLTAAMTVAYSATGAIQHYAGTFDANGYNVTSPFANGTFNWSPSGAVTRYLYPGNGTWTVVSNSRTAWNASGSGLTVYPSSGTIRITGTGAKFFAGGSATYGTIDVTNSGSLTVTGSNSFYDIKNSYTSGANSLYFESGSTNTFSNFTYTGASGRVCTLGASTTSQTTLRKSSTWYMGANSVNVSNNSNLVFTAGGGIDYLSVSYINGSVVAVPSGGSFLDFF